MEKAELLSSTLKRYFAPKPSAFNGGQPEILKQSSTRCSTGCAGKAALLSKNITLEIHKTTGSSSSWQPHYEAHAQVGERQNHFATWILLAVDAVRSVKSKLPQKYLILQPVASAYTPTDHFHLPENFPPIFHFVGGEYSPCRYPNCRSSKKPESSDHRNPDLNQEKRSTNGLRTNKIHATQPDWRWPTVRFRTESNV